MSRMSGIEISSSQGLKKPPKMSPREEKAYLPRAAGPREVSFFFPRAYFKVFYNPRDEEISIPDINGHSENLFLFEFIYVQNLFLIARLARSDPRNNFVVVVSHFVCHSLNFLSISSSFSFGKV